MRDTIMFCHDDTSIFFPCGEGRVFAVSFVDLCRVQDGEATFEEVTEPTDVAGMLLTQFGPDAVDCARNLAPLDLQAKAPRAWIDHGNFDDDLKDVVDEWADYCSSVIAEEDGPEFDDVRGRIERAA